MLAADASLRYLLIRKTLLYGMAPKGVSVAGCKYGTIRCLLSLWSFRHRVRRMFGFSYTDMRAEVTHASFLFELFLPVDSGLHHFRSLFRLHFGARFNPVLGHITENVPTLTTPSNEIRGIAHGRNLQSHSRITCGHRLPVSEPGAVDGLRVEPAQFPCFRHVNELPGIGIVLEPTLVHFPRRGSILRKGWRAGHGIKVNGAQQFRLWGFGQFSS